MRILPAIVLASWGVLAHSRAILASPPDDDNSYGGPIFYATTIQGYDFKHDLKYSRIVYVWIMPPDALEGQPPPQEMIRQLVLNISIQAVPAEDGSLCDPNAPVVYEHGEETFQGCLHGIPMPPQVIQ